MNKRILPILTVATLLAGCVHAGTWVNGYYIDGPLCTVCDGLRVVQHAYGTTVCTHCDGTGIEPPEETVVNTVTIVDAWCPPPPPPRWHRPRPAPPPRPKAAPRHNAAPPRAKAAPRQAPRAKAAPRVSQPSRPAASKAPRQVPRPSGRSRPSGRR